MDFTNTTKRIEKAVDQIKTSQTVPNATVHKKETPMETTALISNKSPEDFYLDSSDPSNDAVNNTYVQQMVQSPQHQPLLM